MAKIKHLNEDQLHEVCSELFEISSSFEGLAALLEWQSGEGCLSSSELFGVGRMVDYSYENWSLRRIYSMVKRKSLHQNNFFHFFQMEKIIFDTGHFFEILIVFLEDFSLLRDYQKNLFSYHFK